MPISNLRMNPLVEKRLHASIPGTTVPLSGYLGPAAQEENVCLYQNLDLTSYIELRREDISEFEDAESDKDPVIVYVKRDAALEVHRTAKTTVSSYNRGSGNEFGGMTIVDPISDWIERLRPKCVVVPVYKCVPTFDNVGHPMGYDCHISGYTLKCD